MKTRNIFYPLFMLLAMLLPTSCSFEEDIMDEPTSNGEKVQMTFNVSLAGASNVESRAFGAEDHNFTVLYLALFEKISDGNYYLKDFITANKENGVFAVNLPKTANPCRLHFIANYPGLSMGFNEEGQLMGLLETLNQEGGHDVFWNYVSLDGIGVNNQTSLSLSVSLLRNYVQVRFDATNSTFTDLDNTTNDTGLTEVQYAIFNVPTKGTVAAYNPLLENKFANFVNGSTLRTYDDLTSDGYQGNEPYDDGTFLGNNNPETIQNTARYWNNLNAPFYMYERSNKQASASKKTCMIIRGKYNGASSYTYYKLDFVYNDANTQSKVYYNLLRNFIYTMRVTSVTGEGYSSVAEAISQPACNNISGDAVVADYTNISNGTSQLFVSSTYVLFTNTKSVDLYFKYIPNVSSPTSINNTSVTITREGDPILKPETEGISAAEVVEDGQYEGWSKVTLTPNALEGASVLNQYITLSAGAVWDGTGDDRVMVEAGLQRRVHLVLRQPYNKGVNWVSVTPTTVSSSNAGQTVTVSMTIPDKMPESLFPLRMFIYSAANTIYATGMPIEVRNGKYGFIREISYDDYFDPETEQYTTNFTANFKTNCAASATTVYVENNYFATGSASFTN